MHGRKLDGFVQRLLIHPPEHGATKKPLLAGQCAPSWICTREFEKGVKDGGRTPSFIFAHDSSSLAPFDILTR